jgi:hypothetical protein
VRAFYICMGSKRLCEKASFLALCQAGEEETDADKGAERLGCARAVLGLCSGWTRQAFVILDPATLPADSQVESFGKTSPVGDAAVVPRLLPVGPWRCDQARG